MPYDNAGSKKLIKVKANPFKILKQSVYDGLNVKIYGHTVNIYSFIFISLNRNVEIKIIFFCTKLGQINTILV